ncbi:hypothetical protein Hanom_Chr11g01053531 [Helianthus anomalus]
MNGVNEPDEIDKISTFWIQMQKNKPWNENCKTGQTSGTKMAFYALLVFNLFFLGFVYNRSKQQTRFYRCSTSKAWSV